MKAKLKTKLEILKCSDMWLTKNYNKYTSYKYRDNLLQDKSNGQETKTYLCLSHIGHVCLTLLIGFIKEVERAQERPPVNADIRMPPEGISCMVQRQLQ